MKILQFKVKFGVDIRMKRQKQKATLDRLLPQLFLTAHAVRPKTSNKDLPTVRGAVAKENSLMFHGLESTNRLILFLSGGYSVQLEVFLPNRAVFIMT